MTTITWDKKILAGDTLTTNSFLGSWDIQSKLFVPKTPVTFEGSRLIAVGGAGNVAAGNTLAYFMLDLPYKTGVIRPARPEPLLAVDFLSFANQELKRLGESSWLLVLTEETCWLVESLTNRGYVTIRDVTDEYTSIGAGAPHARQALDRGCDAIESIFVAAVDPRSETNYRVEYVKHESGAKGRIAWRSFTTLKNPDRKHEVLRAGIGLMGILLLAIGLFAAPSITFLPLYMVGSNPAWAFGSKEVAHFVAFLGCVLTGWYLTTSLKHKVGCKAQGLLAILLLILVAVPWTKDYLGETQWKNLIGFVLAYAGYFVLTTFLAMNISKLINPLPAVAYCAICCLVVSGWMELVRPFEGIGDESPVGYIQWARVICDATAILVASLALMRIRPYLASLKPR